MKVHEAASLLGVTPRALRFYEEKGLLKPRKEAVNGYRLYEEEDLVRLRWIISLRELGLSVAAIQEAMPAVEQPEQWISKLDGARATLYSEWVAAKEALEALDAVMTSWHQSGQANVTQIEYAASIMKDKRLQRTAWHDEWDMDKWAATYGIKAPFELLKAQLSEVQYRDALAQTTAWLDPQTGEHGLELGAGTGNLSELLVSSGAKLTIVEQSVQMLAILRRRLPQVEAKQGNLLSLPLSARTFDFVGASFSMQHLNHAQQLLALEEINRVLLPGGRVVIAGFMNDDRHAAAAADKEAYASPQGFVYSSIRTLMKWLEEYNYSSTVTAIDSSIFLLYATKQHA